MADDTQLTWHDPRNEPFQVAGFGWFATDHAYRRLPLEPAHAVPQPVDDLANCTAGGQIRFRTDAKRIALKVELAGDPGLMDHMAATGQKGFDCYLGEGDGPVRYRATTRFSYDAREYESVVCELPDARERSVVLNLPLFKGVNTVEVGLDAGATVSTPRPFASDRRIIWYGTSIAHGGCASRPGTCFTNILSRRLDREIINLGFSGNGRGEPELAMLCAEIERPGLFVVDYEANCVSTEKLRETFPEFLRILREAHPDVPIVAISRIRFAGELVDPANLRGRDTQRELQRGVVEDMKSHGDERAFFVDGGTLLGDDNFEECTVDGVHPTDLGYMRMADALEPVLKRVLAEA